MSPGRDRYRRNRASLPRRFDERHRAAVATSYDDVGIRRLYFLAESGSQDRCCFVLLFPSTGFPPTRSRSAKKKGPTGIGDRGSEIRIRGIAYNSPDRKSRLCQNSKGKLKKIRLSQIVNLMAFFFRQFDDVIALFIEVT